MESNERERLPELELDDLLNSWEIAVPSERLRAAVFPAKKPSAGRWIGLAAACLLAVSAGALWNWMSAPERSLRKTSVGIANDRPFVPVPYTVPLRPDESATVMRMDVSVAALLAAGFRLPASNAAQMALADVMLGEDGRTLAIRLVTTGAGSN